MSASIDSSSSLVDEIEPLGIDTIEVPTSPSPSARLRGGVNESESVNLRSQSEDLFISEAYSVEIHILRKPTTTLFTLIMPIGICTMLGLCSFAGRLEDQGSNNDKVEMTLGRLEITTTLLLAVMAFQQYNHDKLPALPYLTETDKYIGFSMIHLLAIGIFHASECQFHIGNPYHPSTILAQYDLIIG